MDSTVKWQNLEGLLQDSDGCEPDHEGFLRAMDQFRSGSGIADYFFCDFSEGTPDEDSDLAWDSYNERWGAGYACGPNVEEVDFTGLDEALVAQDI